MLRKIRYLAFCVLILASIDFAYALCVTANVATMRREASTSAAATWTVSKYTPLIEVSKKGNWVEVEDMDGDRHWILRSQVTNKIVCVSVSANSVTLRKAPGLNAALADIRKVDRYTAFKRLDAQETWYQVEAPWGETYWIHENAVWRPVRAVKVDF